MNIVIEGCDGTGKTTIAKFLCDKLGMYYWHESAPRSIEEYQQMLTPGGVVFDRFCFGQFVYNTEEQRKMTKEQLTHLCKEVFDQTHTIVIFVDMDSEGIVRRLIERGEGSNSDKADMISWVKNIRGTYRQILRESGVDYIEINGGKGLCISI